LPPILTAVALLEFTSILLLAPPRTAIVGVPEILREPDSVGWRTMIGIGD